MKVNRDDCWLYAGPLNRAGYGNISDKVDGKYKVSLAHRIFYENFREPIHVGLVCDHLCRVRHCINPWHIEIVTNEENSRRAHGWLTHCKRGHPFVESNTIQMKSRVGRICRTCQITRQRGYNAYRPRAKQRRISYF